MSSSLAAVASRINERNNALRAELASLELLRNEHQDAKTLLDAEEKSTREVREELLMAVRSRHGLELECLLKKGEMEKLNDAVAVIKSKTDNIRNIREELERKFTEEQAPIYATHDISTKVYMMKAEATLERAQTKKRQREEKLAYLHDETKRRREDTSNMRAENDMLNENIMEMSEMEEEEDEDLVALNMQIKSVLEKKASLRKSLKQTKEILNNAAENRDEWERRCVEASN
jgi:DNA repair exonuclease SbcCD ATPase subunit